MAIIGSEPNLLRSVFKLFKLGRWPFQHWPSLNHPLTSQNWCSYEFWVDHIKTRFYWLFQHWPSLTHPLTFWLVKFWICFESENLFSLTTFLLRHQHLLTHSLTGQSFSSLACSAANEAITSVSKIFSSFHAQCSHAMDKLARLMIWICE